VVILYYLSIAETYLAENNYEEALATVANIYEKFEIIEGQVIELMGLQTYIHWLQQLDANNLSIYALPENELYYLMNFVETYTGRGTVFANNILCGLYGICIDEVRDEENEVRGNEAESRKQKVKKTLTLLLAYNLTVLKALT